MESSFVMDRESQDTQRTPDTSIEANRQNVGDVERWVSMLAGGALAVYALKRPSWLSVVLGIAAGDLIYRGTTGHCQVYGAMGVSTYAPDNENGTSLSPAPVLAKVLPTSDIHIRKVVTINASPETLYTFWRNFENLPRIMEHVDAITVQDTTHSHWKVKAPLGAKVEWDAEITQDEPNRKIAWSSTANADIQNKGVVEFKPATGNRGTEVQVALDYSAPGGTLGATFAKLFGEEPDQQVYDDLHHFKQLIEAGEIPTTEGQSSGRPGDKARQAVSTHVG